MTTDDMAIASSELTQLVWDKRYRYRNEQGDIIDRNLSDTWQRVAQAIATVESADREYWQTCFYRIMEHFQFIPGGRILAGAGIHRPVTLFNCFVMGDLHNTETSLMKSLRESANTLQQGGGIGCDFSTLEPRGMTFNSSRADSHGTVSGPVSAMRLWNEMCETLPLMVNDRRGAMMATLRCDHPDIEDFIAAKNNLVDLERFNLSILVTDDFMVAVEKDDTWSLTFPPGHVIRRVSARELWHNIMRANYDYAEPGVLFIDRINRLNNLWYRENIHCTNPCGEVPLPAYGACDLGSINLTRFVRHPFSRGAHLDMDGIRDTVTIATRLLDNVIDLSAYPLEEQKQQAQGARRLGLGISGLADTLIQLGLHYANPGARDMAAHIMETVRDSAYRASIELAEEKGSFPFFDKENYLKGDNVRRLPEDIRAGIFQTGIRNSHLTAIAPTGTISLLAGNISNGIEPVFGQHCQQTIRCGNGSGDLDHQEIRMVLNNPSYQLWLEIKGETARLPDYFVDAHQISPEDHLNMVAVLQPYIDSAISKTVNVATDISFSDFCSIYQQAFKLGLKGCTTFRPNPSIETVIANPGEAL